MTKTIIFTITVLTGLLIMGLSIDQVLAAEPTPSAPVPVPYPNTAKDQTVKAIPDWVRNNFDWYINNQIDEKTLLTSMNWMFDNNIMHLSEKSALEVKQLKEENKEYRELLGHELTHIQQQKGSTDPSTNVPGTQIAPSQTTVKVATMKVPTEGGDSFDVLIVGSSNVDINSLIQQVLRESYLETTEDLQYYADKVKYFNDMKEGVRDYVSDIGESDGFERTNRTMDDPESGTIQFGDGKHGRVPDQSDARTITYTGLESASKTLHDLVSKGETSTTGWDEGVAAFTSKNYDSSGDSSSIQGLVNALGLVCNTALDKEIAIIDAEIAIIQEATKDLTSDSTARSDPTTDARLTTTPTEVKQNDDKKMWILKLKQIMAKTEAVQTGLDVCKAEHKNWEGKLSSSGDDSQLANIDLQNMVQKQQQTLQTMSNVSKMLHDTGMAIIRKIG